MPTPPPGGRARDICIWLVSILLFLSILAGGALLVLYITLPESEDTIWFPTIGMTLVAIPWLFWIMTCFYRSMTQRGEAAAAERPPTRAAAIAPASSVVTTTTAAAEASSDSPVDSPGGRRVHFGTATLASTQQQEAAVAAATGADGKPPDGGADGSSLGSHGSEVPLALSMS